MPHPTELYEVPSPSFPDLPLDTQIEASPGTMGYYGRTSALMTPSTDRPAIE
jgi:hypothetical protein